MFWRDQTNAGDRLGAPTFGPGKATVLRLGLNPNDAFDSHKRGEGLAGRSARGGLAIVGGQGARVALQLVSTVILARLLTPSDYGLIGMVAIVTGFAVLFRDAGFSYATIQNSEITQEETSSVFWITVASSAAITAIVLLSAPIVAVVYRQPELVIITAALSGTFLLSGVSIQHEALLRRSMKFAELGVSQVAGQTASLVVTIGAALMGATYWSLVLGQLTAALVTSGVVFFYCPWIPDHPRRGFGPKRLMAVGGDITGFNVINYFAENSDYLLIGRFIGEGPLGLYTRAYQLFFLPITQITFPLVSVAMPALSALRETPERFAAYVRRLLGVIALLAVPISAYCVLEGDFVIRVLLGNQWLEVIPAFRMLAIGGLVHAVAATRGLVLLSLGMTRKYLQLGVANSLVRLLGVALGLAFGITGVAAGTSIAILVFFVPSLYYFLRDTPIAPTDYLRALGVPLACGAVACAVGLLLRILLSHSGWLLSNALATAAFVMVYVGLALSNRSVRDSLQDLWVATRSREESQSSIEERIELEHDSI